MKTQANVKRHKRSTSTTDYGHVVSFRLPPTLQKPANTALKEAHIEKVESVDQFLKKVAADFLTGKLVYRDPADRNKNPFLQRVQAKAKKPRFIQSVKFSE